jgi:hypothetical protein
MASMQPITQSYVEEPKSCYTKPIVKPYNKGSVMDVLVRESPLMAYIAQVARLDYELDDTYFKGTCFAPCKEYCSRYWKDFKGKLDSYTARRIILSSCLGVQMKEQDLYSEATVFPTLDAHFWIQISDNGKLNDMLIITKADQQCTNGMIHFTNGLMDPNTFKL